MPSFVVHLSSTYPVPAPSELFQGQALMQDSNLQEHLIQ